MCTAIVQLVLKVQCHEILNSVFFFFFLQYLFISFFHILKLDIITFLVEIQKRIT